MNGGDLAFLGDAIYELWIRRFLLSKGETNLQKLTDLKVKYVKKEAQAKAIVLILPHLNENEKDAFLLGRNYKYKTRTKEYTLASGFEALIGFLDLKGNVKRIDELMKQAVKIIDE